MPRALRASASLGAALDGRIEMVATIGAAVHSSPADGARRRLGACTDWICSGEGQRCVRSVPISRVSVGCVVGIDYFEVRLRVVWYLHVIYVSGIDCFGCLTHKADRSRPRGTVSRRKWPMRYPLGHMLIIWASIRLSLQPSILLSFSHCLSAWIYQLYA